MRFAGEDGVAAYGVVMYVAFIFAAVFIGYAVGSAPLLGYHYGAKNEGELKNLFFKSLILLSIGGIAMTTLGIVLAKPLSGVFVGYDKALRAMTERGFMIYSLHFLLCGLNIYGSSLFTALGNGKISAIIAFVRTLVFQSACVMLMPIFFDLDGIWYSVLVSEALALAVTAYFTITKRRAYKYF